MMIISIQHKKMEKASEKQEKKREIKIICYFPTKISTVSILVYIHQTIV